MQGIQICIPVATGKSKTVIAKMRRLLEARYTCRVSRRAFLSQWSGLRKALFLSRDYQELRRRLGDRSGGVCEKCHRRPFEHVHHIEPVAYAPERALLDDNCLAICKGCHSDEH